MPSSTPYDNLICFNFYQGWRAIQEFYASAFPDDLNPQRIYVLGLCAEKPATVSQIAGVLQIDDAAVSNILKRMEKDELITRARSKRDARSYEITATPYGIKIMQETEQKLIALDQVWHNDISDKDINTLHKIVSRLKTHCR